MNPAVNVFSLCKPPSIATEREILSVLRHIISTNRKNKHFVVDSVRDNRYKRSALFFAIDGGNLEIARALVLGVSIYICVCGFFYNNRNTNISSYLTYIHKGSRRERPGRVPAHNHPGVRGSMFVCVYCCMSLMRICCGCVCG
jgi:hypothetical protein